MATLRAGRVSGRPTIFLRRQNAAPLFAASLVLSIGICGRLALADGESPSKLEMGPIIAPAQADSSHRAREIVELTSYVPADHPRGTRARVTLLTLERTSNLRNPVLSTFLIDFAPGGSAILHRAPASGYVLVHVLSGSLTASAWGAGVGTYRAGQTWTEPAFAYGISASNTSAREPAEALVVLVTEDVR
jgi:quercetin dioxygenase-like cupin family protein